MQVGRAVDRHEADAHEADADEHDEHAHGGEAAAPGAEPGRRATARVSGADITAIPAPDTTIATLKQAAAMSSDVPSVLKLCVHQAPVGVMLMLARLPAASSMRRRG